MSTDPTTPLTQSSSHPIETQADHVSPDAKRECRKRLTSRSGIEAFTYMTPKGSPFTYRPPLLDEAEAQRRLALLCVLEFAGKQLRAHLKENATQVLRMSFQGTSGTVWIYKGHILCVLIPTHHPFVKSLKRTMMGTLKAIDKLDSPTLRYV